MNSILYMFFFCPENRGFQPYLRLSGVTKKSKKGLKKGEWWFRMESSGKEWWLVVQSGERCGGSH